MRRLRAVLLVVVLALLVPGGGRAQGPACPEPVARLVSAQGPVELERGPAVRPVSLDDVLCRGDVVRVGPRGRAALALADGGVLRLDQNTTCRVGEEPERPVFDLLVGAVHFLSRATRALEVGTPFVNAAVEGTEFVLRVLPGRALLTVYEGSMRLENPFGRLLVEGGQAAEAEAGRPPVLIRLLVRPRDAVQWALYYPPVLTPLAAPAQAAGLPPALAEAVAAVGRGDVAAAFGRLEDVPEAERGAAYHTLRAGLLLSVGRAEEARRDIDRALALRPGDAEALALGAVIAVAQNDTERATTLARRAVGVDPGSAAAALALSFALQARFELTEAREVLRAAVERHPGDPLLRARLAELELAFGEVGGAREVAEAAVALGPELGRAHTVLGFVELARLDTDAAAAAFRRAIGLEPDAPLPHLGLGLALIRDGDLEAGRREIEVAAGLDPNDALLRSYLGKAYFEERAEKAAADALATAKALDPNDPTPWLYDTFLKRSENRPIDALRALEESIARNENRAVFRSRLLLDEDLATRSASLSRILDELGFEQRAIAEAAGALAADPASFSAHRFLADAYRDDPRFEVARASEILQSQLFQPLILNPFPPSARETELDLPPGAAPAEVGLNEFTPLFERDRIGAAASGVVGNNGTFGDEIIASALAGRYSVSAGQFHYETDGFRENSDLNTDVYSVLGQVAATPWLSLQAEFRHRDTEEGDRRLNFDPELFSPEARRDLSRDTARAGVRFNPWVGTDLVASFIYTDAEETDADGVFAETTRTEVFDEQVLAIHRRTKYSLVAGGGMTQTDIREREVQLFDNAVEHVEFEGDQHNVFIYGNFLPRPALAVTLGANYDDVELLRGSVRVGFDRLSPKVGVQWQATDRLGLRAALVDSVRRVLADELTLEPTQVAGFNQFFDDLDGARARRLGFGADLRLAEGLSLDLMLTRRDLEVPFADSLRFDEPTVVFIDFDERLHRLALNWTPTRRWAFSVGAQYERVRTGDLDFLAVPAPKSVETWEVPLAAAYFDPSGVFARGSLTFVEQEVDLLAPLGFDEGSESFFVVDVELGYRLPDRRGLVSLRVENLFDRTFNFQDTFIQEAATTETNLRFEPDRRVLLRAALNF